MLWSPLEWYGWELLSGLAVLVLFVLFLAFIARLFVRHFGHINALRRNAAKAHELAISRNTPEVDVPGHRQRKFALEDEARRIKEEEAPWRVNWVKHTIIYGLGAFVVLGLTVEIISGHWAARDTLKSNVATQLMIVKNTKVYNVNIDAHTFRYHETLGGVCEMQQSYESIGSTVSPTGEVIFVSRMIDISSDPANPKPQCDSQPAKPVQASKK